MQRSARRSEAIKLGVAQYSRARNVRWQFCYSRYAYRIGVRAENDGRFIFEDNTRSNKLSVFDTYFGMQTYVEY